MLGVATELDSEVLMLDVQTAVLNADLEEEVYVKMASGYETYDKSGVPFVMKLKKILHGLRQSPENWFCTMDDHLSNIGFRSLKSDPCVYVFEDKTGTAMLTLYVDDIILLGNNNQLPGKLKKKKSPSTSSRQSNNSPIWERNISKSILTASSSSSSTS